MAARNVPALAEAMIGKNPIIRRAPAEHLPIFSGGADNASSPPEYELHAMEGITIKKAATVISGQYRENTIRNRYHSSSQNMVARMMVPPGNRLIRRS